MVAVPYIKNVEFERLDMFLTVSISLSLIIFQIINYSLTVLKSQGIDIIDNLLGDLLQKITSVKIPTTSLSDIEKNVIRIFAGFFRIL